MNKCIHCGLEESEHHAFVGKIMPTGCVCDSSGWLTDKIPSICDEYKGDGYNNCDHCEHDKECHKP